MHAAATRSVVRDALSQAPWAEMPVMHKMEEHGVDKGRPCPLDFKGQANRHLGRIFPPGGGPNVLSYFVSEPNTGKIEIVPSRAHGPSN